MTVPQMLPKTLEELLLFISTQHPELFGQLLNIIAGIYDEGSGENVVVIPPHADDDGPLDVMGEDGTGAHELISTGISEEVRRAIRESFAEGIVREKALEWFKGLLMGLSVASFGATGTLSGLTGAAAEGAALTGAGGCSGGAV